MAQAILVDRVKLARRGRRLEYVTIAWNSLEGIVAIIAGAMASSISLVGFGADSFIEVASAVALLWRMSVDVDEHRRERNDRLALRIVGVSFLALSGYVGFESITDLLQRKVPEHSIPGIILACASLLAMPLLSRAKRQVGVALESGAMRGDAKQTEFCAYLSAILLAGLLLNAVFGLWWCDPAAALIIAPAIAKEAVEGIRAKPCQSCSGWPTAEL